MRALLLRLVEVSSATHPFMWLDMCKRIVTAAAVVHTPAAEDDPLASVAVPRRTETKAGAGKAPDDDDMNEFVGGADVEGEDLRDVGDECASVAAVWRPRSCKYAQPTSGSACATTPHARRLCLSPSACCAVGTARCSSWCRLPRQWATRMHAVDCIRRLLVCTCSIEHHTSLAAARAARGVQLAGCARLGKART
jgi:hypothetical protein